mgnify:CR=1 FL=1
MRQMGIAEISLPDMHVRRYTGLGACASCGRDESDVRLYARRFPRPEQSLDPPVCCRCARAQDALDVAEEVLP